MTLASAMATYRAQRAHRLAAALADLADPPDLAHPTNETGPPGPRFEIEYALLHHRVLAVRHCLEQGQREQAIRLATDWVHGDRRPAITRHAVGELMTCWFDRLQADGEQEEGAEQESLRLVKPGDAATLDAPTAAWLDGTLTAIVDCGYQDVVRSGVGILVLIRERGLDQVNRSWTSRLTPCTVYTDFGPVAAIFGAEVVHEATHSWLNDGLAALGIELPPDELYFSPWKQRKRSAFGFLHATLAFSRVFNYLTAVLDRDLVSEDQRLRRYCRVRAAAEGERLASTGDDIAAALDLLTSDLLRTVFTAELDRTGLFGSRFAC